MNNDDHLRYPKGKFSPQPYYSEDEIRDLIQKIESLPARLESLTKTLTPKQLDTPYREGGWTGRQVLHHLPDSHMNAYIRFKWTLTEDTPLIKAYDEKAWATTPENALDPLLSINFLKALHVKWVALLKVLTPDHFAKAFVHPETKKQIRLDRMVALYAWHGDHHLGHIEIIANTK